MLDLSHEDKVQFTLDVEEGQLVGFAANLHSHIDGVWQAVLRIDTAHGRLHRHRFWLQPPHEVDDLPKGQGRDYTSDFKAAREDILANWETYRRLMS